MGIDQFSLQGKRALITGSNRGIGLALARALGSAGATVILNGRDAGRLQQAASQLENEKLNVAVSSFDVTDRDQTEKRIGEIESDVGPINILVNNTGMQHRRELENFEFTDWDRLMDLNLNSIFNVSRPVARSMIARGGGKIINICSIQTRLARPSIAPYTASKHAVLGLTRGMCADWAIYNIQTNGIAPGYFDTELTAALVADPEFSAWVGKRTPAGRWGQVKELGGAAVFLASAASDFVNGQVLFVDGGMSSTV
jgi:gluconate 5-dehydrogenase